MGRDRADRGDVRRSAVRPFSSLIGAIAAAGLIAALIDAIYFSAMAIADGRTPFRVLQSIAGFWLGPTSFDLGLGSALLGAATHLVLATTMAAGFVLVATQSHLLRRTPIVAGSLYGLLLYVLMYFVVLPLRWPSLFPKWDHWTSVLDIGVHVMIGIAIALTVRPFLDRLRSGNQGQAV